MREHGRAVECRELLQEGSRQLAEAGFGVFAPEQPLQMASFRLPACDSEDLFEEFRIEAPVRDWDGQPLLRVSVASYNTAEDLHQLQAALGTLFPEAKG